MGWLDIMGGAAQAASESGFDQVQKRADRAVEAVRLHKQSDKKLPCGHIHFDMVEAVDAQHAMGSISYAFARTFTRQIFAACISSCLMGGSVTGLIMFQLQKRETARNVQAIMQAQRSMAGVAKRSQVNEIP
jgi:hypothetical protein